MGSRTEICTQHIDFALKFVLNASTLTALTTREKERPQTLKKRKRRVSTVVVYTFFLPWTKAIPQRENCLDGGEVWLPPRNTPKLSPNIWAGVWASLLHCNGRTFGQPRKSRDLLNSHCSLWRNYLGALKGTELRWQRKPKNADFRRKPQIFADSPLLLEIPAFGGRRIFAENRRFSQKTADFLQIGLRHLRRVTFSSAPNWKKKSTREVPPRPRWKVRFFEMSWRQM